jgi:uncharacterized membrane protein YfcA
MTLLSELGLGLLLGWLGGLFGIGGGLMAIPALVALFAMDQALAQGTALVMIAPNVLLGFWRYRQHNPIDIRSACLLGSCSIVSTYALARWAANLDMHTMRLMFAAFLIALSAYMAWGLRSRTQDAVVEPRITLSKAWFPLLGLLSGVFSGLFTVGGGLVVAPALMKWFGVNKQTMAQGLALATVTPGAVVALATYAQAGKVDWSVGIPLAVGGMLSMSLGVALAHRLPERLLRLLFCVLMGTTGLVMLFKP